MLLVAFIGFSQPADDFLCLHQKIEEKAGKDLVFSYVDTIQGKSKDDLYFTAKTYFVETYGNPEEVILLDNPNKGVIAGRSGFTYQAGETTVNYYYYIQVRCRDGRYKVESKDISYAFPDEDGMIHNEYMLKDMKETYLRYLPLVSDEEAKKKKVKRSVRSNFAGEVHREKFRKQRKELYYTILNGADKKIKELFATFNTFMMVRSVQDMPDDW